MIALADEWRDSDSWDGFVRQQDEARFCHFFDYSTALACYGYTERNLCFLRGSEIVGVLPAVQVKSLLYGRKLVSQPFSEYGGLLLSPDLSPDEVGEVFALLSAYAKNRARVAQVEMHGNHGVPPELREKWTVPFIPQKLAFLPLDRPIDDIWRKVLEPAARKKVNQAVKNGLTVVSECDEQIIRTRFFPMYLLAMKRLGAPPHTINYYLNCKRAFGERMMMYWAKKDETVIAGLLGFSTGTRVSVINTVSDPAHWNLRPNDLLHWEFVKWAAANGHSYFDFGNVRYDGQMGFKAKWGCQLAEHKFYLMQVAGKSEPSTLDSSSDSMQRMASLWSRYVPLSAGRLIGPHIRKQLVR